MVSRTFAELVKDLRMRRTVGDKPPVLLLGAGASADAGIGAMQELFAFFGCADFEAFCKYIGQTSAAERYRYLSDFLQTGKQAEVSPGYQALATLCAEKYFDLVLTTNMDPLLDDAVAAARMWRRDYLLIVNGVIRPDRLELLLGAQRPRVKVVKLHGDLFQRFMAWTVEEMDDFLTQVAPFLKPAVAGRDFLVVGHSLRDARVRELVESTSGSLWFTHPDKVPDYLTGNATMRAVVAPECAFERFFPALALGLQVEAPQRPLQPAQVGLRAPAPVVEGAETLDDVISSVFAVAGPQGTPSSTAFLLARPRVIVCDTFATGAGDEFTLIARGDRPFKTRVVRINTAHPFGPTLLEAPESLRVPGLRLDAELLQPGEVVTTAVAAGAETGISRGIVTEGISTSVNIDPIGVVRDLVSLNCLVRPGASGAPVVDSKMSVRGFIVAGSMDESRPVSLMYPTNYWVQFLLDEKSTRSRKARGKAKKR